MNKYSILLDINKVKLDFILDLISCFGGDASKWELINSKDFRHYKSLKKEREKGELMFDYHKQRLAEVTPLFNHLKTTEENKLLNLTVTQYALVRKVEHIIFNRGGFKPVYEMLKSFEDGVKNLKTGNNTYNHERQYHHTNKDGNFKLSHKGNLPKAHFRWNYDKRYVLNNKDIEAINKLISVI